MGSAPLLVGVSFTPNWPEIQAFVTGAGFSVFVAVWFMVRHDKRLSELSEAIRELRETLILITGRESAPRRAGMGETGSGGREKES